MKRNTSQVMGLLLGILLASTPETRADPAVAAKPPMGWNSFDSYGVYLHEKAALANIEAMADKLKPHGYEYFVIDNGWFGEYKLQPDGLYPAEKHAHDVRLDEHGLFLPSKTYFPNGFAPLVKACRDNGLKFGVHLMRGIPRKAVELNLPIKGTKYRAADIANTRPKDNCGWCKYNYAVDMSKPGAQEWYDSIIQHVVDMGVEFIKYDDIVPYPREVEAVAKAIRKTSKPVVLSLSPGDGVNPNAIDSFRMGNMLRVTSDIWDEQRGINSAFKAWKKWQGKEKPGFWIDLDMIPFGKLQLMSPPGGKAGSGPDIALAGKGSTRVSELSQAQKETFITMRALAATPLMMGGDLPTLDKSSLRLITDPDMLACNQNGVMGRFVSNSDGFEVWQTPAKDSGERRGWVGIFNRTSEPKQITPTAGLLGLDKSRSLILHDIWSAKKKFRLPATHPTKFTIPPNGVLFLKYQ